MVEIKPSYGEVDENGRYLLKNFLDELSGVNIGFDIDGTINYTAGTAVRNYNEKFGISKPRYEYQISNFYGITNWLIEDHNLEPEDAFQAANSIWNDPSTIVNSVPERGAQALIRLLSKNEIIPYFITSRPSQNVNLTLQWMAKYFPMIPENRIYIQKNSFFDPDFKAKTVRTLGIKYFFEDSIEHAKVISQIEQSDGIKIIVGFIRQPWNTLFIPEPGSNIICPMNYNGRSEIIRTFLSVFDYWKLQKIS